MVKELQVKEPEVGVPWEQQEQFLYEYSVEGIPLPDKMETLLEDRFALSVGDRDPAAVRSEKEWDLYYLWLEASPQSIKDLPPGERLWLYNTSRAR